MTWQEWVNSNYNTNSYIISVVQVLSASTYLKILDPDFWTSNLKNSQIISGITYCELSIADAE